MPQLLTSPLNIHDFFAGYARALEQQNVKAMGTFYHIPCLFLDDEGAVSFTDAAQLEGLFAQGTMFYQQHGIDQAQPEIRSRQELTTAGLLELKVRWQYNSTKRNNGYTADYLYILRRDKKGDHKIAVVTSLNEKQRMNDWLARQD